MGKEGLTLHDKWFVKSGKFLIKLKTWNYTHSLKVEKPIV